MTSEYFKISIFPKLVKENIQNIIKINANHLTFLK